MKFSEYLASFITPQMTLLEKFNAMCKYLDENGAQTLFIHSIRFTNSTFLTFINTENKTYTIEEIKSMLNRVLELKYDGSKILKVVSSNLFYCNSSGEITSINLNNLIVYSQTVEKYEN